MLFVAPSIAGANQMLFGENTAAPKGPNKSAWGNGRDHNPTSFTMWMAGGGVKGGQTIGTTDELGLHAIEDRMQIRDLHATILNLMGLNHMELTYMFHGRQQRPTQNEGNFLEKLVTG